MDAYRRLRTLADLKRLWTGGRRDDNGTVTEQNADSTVCVLKYLERKKS
jgi:hypothetical protein